MRPRVALATFDGFPELYEDDRLALGPLADAGVDAEPVLWDSGADWASYDLGVVRSTWDYTLRREEFLDWASQVPRHGPKAFTNSNNGISAAHGRGPGRLLGLPFVAALGPRAA